MRFSTVRSMVSSRLPASGHTWSPIAVSIGPGWMELARMPSAPYCTAVDLVNSRTAPLEAL